MNAADRIDRFFEWDGDDQALEQALPDTPVMSAVRWWNEVMCHRHVYVDADEQSDVIVCAVLADPVAAHAGPCPARLVSIDWLDWHGVAGAMQLHEHCAQALRQIGVQPLR